MSSISRDMLKARRIKKLNTVRYVPHAGAVISHAAQGILRNSRKVKKDHVIWKPEDDRSHEKNL